MTRLAHPRFGLDYTDAGFTAAQHHSYGSSFALRYLSRYSWKVLNPNEVRALHAGGIDLAVVFEDGADNALHGRAQGEADARYAREQARYCGMPRDRPIYFAVDFPTAGNAAATDSYFDGIASVLSRELSGPYGGHEVVRRQLDRGHAYAWQTYAWSAGLLDARAQLYQYSNGHGSVDYNHAYAEDFGQWAWRARLADPDPHHYARFPAGPFPDPHGKLVDERAAIEAYDHLMASRHSKASRQRLVNELVFLRERIVHETLTERSSPDVYWRRWRWEQINARLAG
ncbi:MAG: glycoside hydrolase domain-containing protein [Solirubrobacteraceae bacterium]